MDIVPVLIVLVGYALGLVVLFFVIKYSVLAALREHTLNSTTAVMVRQSVPIEVKQREAG